jgi:hypothetical protein
MRLVAYRVALNLRNAARVPIAFPTCMSGLPGVALRDRGESVGASEQEPLAD